MVKEECEASEHTQKQMPRSLEEKLVSRKKLAKVVAPTLCSERPPPQTAYTLKKCITFNHENYETHSLILQSAKGIEV